MLESSLWAHISITINIERSLKAVTWPDHLLILRPKGHLTRVGPMAHQSRTWQSSRPLARPSVQFPLTHFNFLWHVTNHKTIVATRDAIQVTRHVTVTRDTSNKNDSTTTVLWCTRLKHHHFCTIKFMAPILPSYLIPLVKTLLFGSQTKLQERFLFASKLIELRKLVQREFGRLI